jgi:hypothetical protein
MKKLTLMKKFMQNYVGKGIHLIIKEKEGNLKVHTIEIMQKTDETCPVKNISVGDYFLHLVAINPQGGEASIVCDWSDDLLKSLIANYREIKDAECTHITMFKDPSSCDANKWLLTWGNEGQINVRNTPQKPKKDPVRYIT